MNDYLFEYTYQGSEYSMIVRADDPEQAKQRLWRAATAGAYKGKVAAVVPVPGGGLLLRLWNWLRQQ